MNVSATEVRDRIDAFGATLLISFSALLGLNQALVKLVNEGLHPVFQAGLRSVLAFVLVYAWARYRRIPLSLRDGSAPLGVLCGCFFAGEFALMFLALDYTTVARLSLFVYTRPFFVAIAAHFMFPGERLTTVRSLGLALATAGVALALFENSDGQAGAQAWIGDLMALGAALFWAALTLLLRGTRLAQVSNEQNLLYQLFVSAVVLILIAPLFGDLVRDLSATVIGILTFQAVFVVSIGYLTWIWVLHHYPVSDMAAFSLLTPIFGVAAGALMFGDALTPIFLTALALVAGGLYLMNRKPRT